MTLTADLEPLPDLVTLGDAELMRPQPAVDMSTIRTEAFQRRLDVLRRCMHHYGGIGIAAPQIGWAARVFCLGIEETSARYPAAEPIEFAWWINPEITVADATTNWAWEGCLSVPGMRGWVERPATVTVTGYDENGQQRQRSLAGFAARVFQHEHDHLDGVLYPMRVSEPRWLLADAIMARQTRWAPDWPSPGARVTAPGELADSP